MTASSSILSEVDELHGRFQFTESYEKFSEWMENNESDELSLELQSRWARTLYYYGMFVASKHEKKHVFERGLAVAKKLCEHSDSGIAHLWYGVLLGTVLKSASYKRQLEICPEVGVHLQLAIEMLPDSFDALHGYGRYLYEISDLSGVLKTILKLAHRGHKLPNCSYEEALKIFLRAEALKPESLSVNTLYIGKCYMHLHQREQAIPYLKTAANWKARFADDENAKKEAKTLLAQIGIKHWEN